MSTTITSKLQDRCEGLCELCTAETASIAFAVSPKNNNAIENEVAICQTCLNGLENKNMADHWQCEYESR